MFKKMQQHDRHYGKAAQSVHHVNAFVAGRIYGRHDNNTCQEAFFFNRWNIYCGNSIYHSNPAGYFLFILLKINRSLYLSACSPLDAWHKFMKKSNKCPAFFPKAAEIRQFPMNTPLSSLRKNLAAPCKSSVLWLPP